MNVEYVLKLLVSMVNYKANTECFQSKQVLQILTASHYTDVINRNVTYKTNMIIPPIIKKML